MTREMENAMSGQQLPRQTYAVISQLIAAEPALAGFSQFDTKASPVERAPNPIPAIALVQALAGGGSAETAACVAAIAAAAPAANWQQSYTEDEVGRDFLNRYGYFELIGPTGHFLSGQTRAYIAYWGDHLYYPWHLHQAEEIYYVLAGQAQFESEGQEEAIVGPGGTRYHASNQPHAMTTFDQPILALVLWRGAGLDGGARIGRG